MSLKRRITAASALAAAAVAIALAITSYLSTRSQLITEIQHELSQRVAFALQRHDDTPGGPFNQPGPGESQPGAPGGSGTRNFHFPPAPAGGGAAGIFQTVYANGTVRRADSKSVLLPVDARVRAIARAAHGSFYTDATLKDVHYEVLTIGDPYDHYAVEVAIPLTGVDSVLHNLLLTYGLLISGGILAAGLLSLLIARSALAPIERFSEQTEQVTSALERPRRLEETGPAEMRRLAGSFNQTLDALERSLQAQRHLIADASHELRTPLAALRSNVQIFLEAERLPAEEREGLQEAVLAELDELTQIVADVVALARGSAPSDQTEPVELDQVVGDAVARAQRRSPGLSFEVSLEPTVITNVAERVARAVTNVVDNARKWSPEQGTVFVELSGGVLTVRDQGPGFKEADLPHVFERFYRADAARRMPGSGLGLAIVKQAAEAYDGTVSAANWPGGGAAVTVRFGSAGGVVFPDHPIAGDRIGPG